ncbi:MAG: Gmad2 immunoglobulin-like domain-containing protein [Chloroflexota bacterium]
MRRVLRVLAILMCLLPAAVGQAQAASCHFVLGFATLAGLIPQTVGQCVENESHNPATGDTLQHTTGGLLVWRQADNWTAFTDGNHTWLNGPNGLQQRLNTQRFSWEANSDGLPLADATGPGTAAISVRQPQPYDLVDDPVQIAGVGTGFEGTFAARVRDGNGTELARVTIHAGGTGILGNFQVALPLGGTPTTAAGTLEVFESSAKGDGSELNKVIIPITFGEVIVTPYHGFARYTVLAGDTLATIAQHWYGNAARAPLLQAANRDQLSAAQPPHPGQVLRIPQ